MGCSLGVDSSNDPHRCLGCILIRSFGKVKLLVTFVRQIADARVERIAQFWQNAGLQSFLYNFGEM